MAEHGESAGRSAGDLSDAVLNFFSPAARSGQYDLLGDLRAAGPIHPTPLGPYLLTRYEDCAEVLQNGAWSHAQEATLLHPGVAEEEAKSELPTSFLWMDPPDHTRLRNLVSKVFTARRVAGLRPRIAELAGRLVDDALEAGEFDRSRQSPTRCR
jgi:cytochrome P450